jgi:hypothetical protein
MPMLEALDHPAEADSALAPRSPVRCSLCNLPVVRSVTDPPVLLHQTLAGHRGGDGAVDFFMAEGPCPQEGVAIPADRVALIPAAAAGWAGA